MQSVWSLGAVVLVICVKWTLAEGISSLLAKRRFLFAIHNRRNAVCVAFLLSLVFQLLAVSISCCIWHTWIRIWRYTIFMQATCIIQSMMAYAHAILKQNNFSTTYLHLKTKRTIRLSAESMKLVNTLKYKAKKSTERYVDSEQI